ncbi:MAG: lipocalin family protein [Bacteroidales bacterium]|jgi:hypothetical protein|nr:lipocalin family protein [Bacteroidales bacterium]MCI1733131.1 lipocalin family protein [Bacteroidales bacterium]
MRKFLTVLAVAVVACVACKNTTPGEYTGWVVKSGNDTLVVKALLSDSTQTFLIAKADLNDANGMIEGSPVVVDYVGKVKPVIEATKVACDPTYAKAIGSWTHVAAGMPDSLKEGVELMVGGEAKSINMATLVYSKWELAGPANKVILHVKSIGNGVQFDTTENATISEVNGQLTLALDGTEVTYTKEAPAPAAESVAK